MPTFNLEINLYKKPWIYSLYAFLKFLMKTWSNEKFTDLFAILKGDDYTTDLFKSNPSRKTNKQLYHK